MENSLLHSLCEKLNAQFKNAVTAAEQHYDFPVFLIERSHIHEVIKFLFEDESLGFRFLTTMCGLHYPDQKGKELGVMYQLHNLPKNQRIRLKTFFPVNDPVVPTITDIFSAANWMERQEYDFYGIIFKGHPNLKRILNVDDMDYFPMRKEYALEDATREDKNDSMFGR